MLRPRWIFLLQARNRAWGKRMKDAAMPITEEWLKESGFRWHRLERQPDKHWLLWLGDAMGDGYMTSYEDIGIEVAPMFKRQEWFCWLRSDCAGQYHRFIHLRHISC